jgi:ABC-type iron transport system FetAB ATPase subunit
MLLIMSKSIEVKPVKASKREHNILSRSIDKASEGLDAIIELYNELEEDRPIIQLDEEVLEALEKAKENYGEDMINEKINALIKEALSWLQFNQEENSS